MTFCIRDIGQTQTTTPAEVDKLNPLFKNTQSAFIRGGIVNSNIINVYMKVIYSSVDLTYCQLYPYLTGWRHPSTVVSINNRKGAPCGRNHEICKTRGNLRSAINLN